MSARVFRYLVVALLVLAAGGGIAKAAPPIDIFRLADATNAAQLAKVDATGAVAVKEANDARQPFQREVQLIFISAFEAFGIEAFPAVPAGKRWVIESVSADSGVPAGRKLMEVILQPTANGVQTLHHLTPTNVGVHPLTGNQLFLVTQSVRLYVDGGTKLSAYAICDSNSCTGYVNLSVSGYLVDVP
jgi:hypothetical protein